MLKTVHIILKMVQGLNWYRCIMVDYGLRLSPQRKLVHSVAPYSNILYNSYTY